MAAQPSGADELDTLVCDGKTLRGSIDEIPSSAEKFFAQVSHFSQTLGLAFVQTTDAEGEILALRRLLEVVPLDEVLMQADALHTNRTFPSI